MKYFVYNPSSSFSRSVVLNRYEVDNTRFSKFKLWVWKRAMKWFNLKQVYEYEEHVHYQEVSLNTNNLIKVLYEHLMTLRHHYNRDIRTIVVGHDVASMILTNANDPRTNFINFSEITLPHDHSYYLVWNDRKVTLAGISVMVIPWFKGIVCLPSEV